MKSGKRSIADEKRRVGPTWVKGQEGREGREGSEGREAPTRVKPADEGVCADSVY
jgi:hypothetical protein